MISQRTHGFTSAAVIAARVVLVAALSTVLVGELFDLGFVKRTESFQGPFVSESSETSHSFIVALRKNSRLGKLFTPSGDWEGDPSRSDLRLWINGQSAGPPHALHREIRDKGGGRYSHWGDVVLFSLPAGATNGPSTTAVVEYSPRLQAPMFRFGWLALVSSTAFLAFRAWRLDPESLRRRGAFAARLGTVLCLAIFAAAAAATAAYIVTIVIGVAQGYALPNTAVFRLLPWTRELAIYEPAAQYLIAVVAMIGAVLSWLAPSASRKDEATLIRYWNRYGLVVIAALFLFSLGAPWAGIARREDLQSNATGGLVPFHDARGYFDMTFVQVITGHWEPLAEQRPFAAAHRSLLMFLAGYSNVRFLFLQALALAAVTYASTRAVMLWRGLWSGLTFLALTLALVRPYLMTDLTEPLGQFWTLLSVPFVIRLLRRDGLVDGAVSLLGTTMSLLTRMGSMFTIPALAIWLAWTQRYEARRLKLTLLTITAVLVGCSLVSLMLFRLYGSGSGFLGSNFSWVICGATHGGDWRTCPAMYEDDLRDVGPGFGAVQADYFYAKAWEAFRRDPSVLFHRLIEGEHVFGHNLIPVMLGGYTQSIPPRWFSRQIWTLVAVCGLMITFWRRREQRELSFWLFMWLGLFASAPFVIFADGWRTLSSIFPFVALFFACGFATRTEVSPSVAPAETRTPQLALAGLLVTMSLWIVIPGLAHRLDPVGARAFNTLTANTGERVVLGSRHMAGFIVVPDDLPLPTDVPAMRRSEFAKAFEYSGNGSYQTLTLPSPSTAFAFVAAPNANGTRGYAFIAPPEVLTHRDVPAWRFSVEEPIDGRRTYWLPVSAATPVAAAPR